MKKKCESVDALAPRPVHPRAVRFHGLFGMGYVKQHMIVDTRWAQSSLMEEFKGMTDLLGKRLAYKKLEFRNKRRDYLQEYRNLRLQCQDGRQKLQMSLFGSNAKKIRKYMINHKDMQRLYQRMPIHLVVENLDQRTFVMRKERDRLHYRLKQLRKGYREQLIYRASLENRIKYDNEFILEEETKAREFIKKIENSKVRLKAIKTLNEIFKKMIQVLQHDSIFYEPILRSLTSDFEDQAQFIKHILYLGAPAITKFKELSEEYRELEKKYRKNNQMITQWLINFRKKQSRRMSPIVKTHPNDLAELLTRYVRETPSMLVLKSDLETLENSMNRIKSAALCSQAKEIFPRMKEQVENNEKLLKKVENDSLLHETLEIKKKQAEVWHNMLVNSLTEEEIMRLQAAKEIEKQIQQAEEYADKKTSYIKNRRNAFVILRCTLWNLMEILRHVDRPIKVLRKKYPETYLELPLLKYDMLMMHALPPLPFEEDLSELFTIVKRKVYKLMNAYKFDLSPTNVLQNMDDYHNLYLKSGYFEESTDSEEIDEQALEDDLISDAKSLLYVPNRKQIKAQSLRLVEEHVRREVMEL